MPVLDDSEQSCQGEPRRLEARFESAGEFAREYACNVSQGGIFIATAERFELREIVVVELVLAFRDERIALDGEVVAERPALGAAPPGVAVQLLAPASELRERLAPIAGEAAPRSPEGSDDLPIELDERSALRRPTRVDARMGDRNRPVQTRDLSARGALIELSDDLPAVGAHLEVALRHPVSGQELALEAEVVRHHEEGGSVRAVGVRFEPHAHDEAGVERLVEDVQAAAHARSLGGIRGAIDTLGLASLLQMFGASAQQGTLRVARDGQTGSVAFDSGVLRHARLGELSGMKALARLLSWRDGSFEFHAQVDPHAPEDPPSALDAAIFEAVRQLDELQRAALPSSTAEGAITLDRARLSAEPGPLEKVEEAVVDLIAAGFPFVRVLDVIPVPDFEIHAATRALLERGVLVAAAPAAAR